MTRRINLAFAAAVAIAFLTTGCNGEDTPTGPSEFTAPPAAAPNISSTTQLGTSAAARVNEGNTSERIGDYREPRISQADGVFCNHDHETMFTAGLWKVCLREHRRATRDGVTVLVSPTVNGGYRVSAANFGARTSRAPPACATRTTPPAGAADGGGGGAATRTWKIRPPLEYRSRHTA